MKSADKCFTKMSLITYTIMQKNVNSFTNDLFSFLFKKKLKAFADDNSNDDEFRLSNVI